MVHGALTDDKVQDKCHTHNYYTTFNASNITIILVITTMKLVAIMTLNARNQHTIVLFVNIRFVFAWWAFFLLA